MLLNTGTEEIAHIEMLATAVALYLEGAPADMKEVMAKTDGAVGAVLGGTDIRHYLSAGLGASDPTAHAQTEQMMGAGDKSFLEKAADVITGKHRSTTSVNRCRGLAAPVCSLRAAAASRRVGFNAGNCLAVIDQKQAADFLHKTCKY